MSDSLDDLLQKAANTHSNGIVALAHLRRRDEDAWDFLVVDRSNLPLMVWSSDQSADSEEAVTDGQGRVLSVIEATPPGATPSGLLLVPGNEHGSPLGRLVGIVGGEEWVMVEPLNKPPGTPGQAAVGANMLDGLLAKSARRTSSGDYYTVELDAADGGQVPVAVDWDGRPLMFWIDLPGNPPKRDLFALAVTSEGLIAVSLDLSLRPTRSGEDMLPPPAPAEA